MLAWDMDEVAFPHRDRNWIKRAPRIDGEHDALVADGAGCQYTVRILDISGSGFKLEGKETFRIGEYVGIRVSKYGDFSAQIRWALGNQAGGVFLDPIVLPPPQRLPLKTEAGMSKHLDSGVIPNRTPWPRKSVRVDLSAEVALRRSGHGSFRVKIIDISPLGCKAEFVDRPNLDELVWIKFDGLQSLEAMVCWTCGFDVGLEFERPIHQAVFDMLIQRLKT